MKQPGVKFIRLKLTSVTTTADLIFRDVNEVPGELVGRVQVSRGLGVVQRGGELKKVFLRRLHLSSGVMALWPSGWTSGGSGV